MADDSQDKSSKTEEATPKKLEEARKKGQVAQTRELNHFFMLLAFTVIITVFSPGLMRNFLDIGIPFLAQTETMPVAGVGLTDVTRTLLTEMILLVLIPVIVLFVAALSPAILQRNFFFAADRIKPKLEKISPIKGFGRVFGMRAFVEFFKSVLKISLVALIAYLIISPNYDRFVVTNNMTIPNAMDVLKEHLFTLLAAMTFFLLLISFADYFYQRFEYLKNLKMSRQEVKDEHRQAEGDPQMKMRRRQIARERVQKQMMAAVPKADVVITNPTHYAVALQYDQETMQAPMVVAKGVDKVAFRIRDVAEKNKVFVMRNPPLARTLYDTAEIDEEIPHKHYEAVAKVISYVYKLKGKTLKPSGVGISPKHIKKPK